MDDIVLQCSGVAREFRGQRVLDGVDLSVRRGSLHGLVGASGAGKTTLFNIITNTLVPTSGRIVFDGLDIAEEKAAQTQRRGLVRAFQAGTLLPQLSALENVRLTLQRKAGLNLEYWRKGGGEAFEDLALDVLAQEKLDGIGATLAGELDWAMRRRLEIVLALAHDPLLLLVDEPLAELSGPERGQMQALLGRIAGERSLLVIENDLAALSQIADAVTQIDNGRARALVRTGASFAPVIRLATHLGAAA